MKYNVTHLDGCRICGNNSLYCFLTLDQMPFTDDFIYPENAGKEFLYSISIYWCNHCGTVQTQHDVEVNEYYQDYQYSVGESAFASAFMTAMAQKLCSTYFPGKADIKVLEIGSGDGGQLVPFKNYGCTVLGFEPSDVLVKVAAQKGIPSVQGLFTENAVSLLPDDFKKVDIILLSYTFDHIPDPIGFLKAVKKILNPHTGIVVIENHDLEKIFERNEYCLFEHEHSIYLTKKTAISLAKRNGFDIIEFDVLPEEKRRANSLIFVMSLKDSDYKTRAINDYPLPGYDTKEFFDKQTVSIKSSIHRLEQYISDAMDKGKKIAGYGAGGRGIMTLAALKNSNQLKYLVDKKPKAQGVYSPKSHLPVFDITHLAKEPVDEIIVFSFGYIKEITSDLIKMGYREDQIISLLSIIKD